MRHIILAVACFLNAAHALSIMNTQKSCVRLSMPWRLRLEDISQHTVYPAISAKMVENKLRPLGVSCYTTPSGFVVADCSNSNATLLDITNTFECVNLELVDTMPLLQSINSRPFFRCICTGTPGRLGYAARVALIPMLWVLASAYATNLPAPQPTVSTVTRSQFGELQDSFVHLLGVEIVDVVENE